VLRNAEGNIHGIAVRDWVQQKQFLIDEVHRLMRDGYAAITTYQTPKEEEDVRALINALGGQVELRDFRYEDTRVDFVLTYDKLSLWRVAAKIAFHYALTQLAGVTGHENWFDGVKRFIMEGVGAAYVIRENTLPLDRGIRSDLGQTEWLHVLACSQRRKDFMAHCRLFDHTGMPTVACDVTLGSHDMRIIPEPHFFAHRFRYFADSEKPRHGIMEKINIPLPVLAWP
jgi:hypothetical protein